MAGAQAAPQYSKWCGSGSLGAAKQRALLAALLMQAGETLSTERLVDALWGERPPATAVKALQVYVSQLRKALGDGVVDTRPLG